MKMVTYTVTYFQNPDSYGNYSTFVLGADVGGTHTKIAFAGVKNEKPILLFSLNYKSTNINDPHLIFIDAVEYAKKEFNIDVQYGCIGAAGIISEDNEKAVLTNLSWNIDCKLIREKTGLSGLFVINDFQIIGYGISVIDLNNCNDVLSVNPDDHGLQNLPRVVIGAGTGLGKGLLIYDREKRRYIPMHSEGGHGDVPVYSPLEFECIQFIQQKYHQHVPVTYEQVLSGPGLMNIYEFLSTKQNTDVDNSLVIRTPDDLSQYRKENALCRSTFSLFMSFYARCIKNYVLDTMALGGVFIAGGIAMRNSELFQSDEFKDEIVNAFQRSDILQQVPLYVLINPNVGLTGACHAAIEKYELDV